MIDFKKTNKLLLYAFVVFALSSCSIGYHGMSYKQGASMAPDVTGLRLTTDDISYMGETNISVLHRHYFGLFTTIDSINNEPYERRFTETVSIVGMNTIKLSNYLQKASYQIIEQFPEADYFVVVHNRVKTDKMFLGKIVREEAKIRAYQSKIK